MPAPQGWVGLLLAPILWATLAPLQAQPVWRFETSKPIKFFSLLESDPILIGTEQETVLADKTSGAIIWSQAVLRNCRPIANLPTSLTFTCRYDDETDLQMQYVGGASPALIGFHAEKGRLAVIDLRSGRVQFDSASLSIPPVRGHLYSSGSGQVVLYGEKGDDSGIAGVRVSDGKVMWESSVSVNNRAVWLTAFGDGGVLLHGQNRQGRPLVAEIDPKEGRVRWESFDLATQRVDVAGPTMVGADKYRPRDYRLSPAIADTESTAILFITKDGPMRINRSDGKLIWRDRALSGEHPSQMLWQGEVL